jgi:hypothetical protein
VVVGQPVGQLDGGDRGEGGDRHGGERPVEGSHRASSRSIQILTMGKSLRLISIYVSSPALSHNKKKPASNSKQQDSQPSVIYCSHKLKLS